MNISREKKRDLISNSNITFLFFVISRNIKFYSVFKYKIFKLKNK